MKPRFIKWILLVLLFTIVTTEGLRGPGLQADEGKAVLRVRGSPRFSSRKTGSSETTSEGTPQNPDVKSTTKPSRFSTTRKVLPSKSFGRHSTAAPGNGSGSAGGASSGSIASASTASRSTTEHSLPKSRIEAALQRRADKLKANPQKPHPHGLLRVPIRKLGQKGQTPEPEKSNNATESPEDGEEGEDRRYLPDGLSEEAKNAKDEEEAEGLETPKVNETPQAGSQKNVRYTGNRSKQKLDNSGSSASGSVADNSRSRTGRKIQSQAVLSPKQLRSNVPSSTRFTKVKEVDEESEVESTTDAVEAGSIRRSFEVEPPVPRKKSNDRHDITASGSESVRINIPLNFEDSKKIGGSSDSNVSSDNTPKRSINLRYKPRSKPTVDDKKVTSETTTTASTIPIRGVTRRTKVQGSRVQESSTEATTARSRLRTYESRKSNSVVESTSTTAQPDLRRRNYKQKPTTKSSDNNVVTESKSHDNSNTDNKKPNRLRGRYRPDVTTVATSQTSPNAPFIHPTVGTTFGAITPSYLPEYSVTALHQPSYIPTAPRSSVPPTAIAATAPRSSVPPTVVAATPPRSSVQPTLAAATVPRASVQPTVVAATSNVETTKIDEEDEDESLENGQKRRSSKEDFFNHGLGFRGRRPPIPGAPEVTPAVTTSTISTPTAPTTPRLDSSARGNPGWTLRRRPGHWNDGQTSGPSANPGETIPPIEQDGRIITTTTTPASSTTQKPVRRGSSKAKGALGGKSDETAENDNYPPDFKERIAQLQKTGGPPKSQTEEPQLQTSSNVTGSASADLELAPSENEYLLVTQTAHPISSTTLSLQIPSNLEEQQASKTPSEIFAARSKMKLDNARKLVKPELNIDETSARQVVVDPSASYQVTEDQNPSDSEVLEDQKVIKVARKASLAAEKPENGQNKGATKSDWKPSKLRKDLKENQPRTSRYKQAHLYTNKPKTISTVDEKSNVEENDVTQTTKSSRTDRYQDYKYRYVPKSRDYKPRGPKPSNIEGRIEENQLISTTKSPLIEKPRKTFTPRKNDKNYIEDIKAVAMKLRKTLESIEKSQTSRPPRKIDFPEVPTTLLTTMRTVKSFSFSTRLVKMDESESASSSTTEKMLDEDETKTTGLPTSTSFVTEIVTQNPADNEVTTSQYENVLASSHPPNDLVNEIENSGVLSTDESLVKSSTSSNSLDNLVTDKDWKLSVSEFPASQVDYKPRTAALTNDSGSPVFVVYPSATEKPLSIAITPKVYRYHATVKPPTGNDTNVQQPAMQEPVISVKVSNSSDFNGSGDTGVQGSAAAGVVALSNGSSNIFSPSESAAILKTGNYTILEQLRSTVAPLLGTLGAKSPVFAGVYKNTNSANSLPRVTPSGAPPKFSARYRGAELFVRRPTPPTITSSENIDSASMIDVSSPGESKVLTFYQAVETADINNEQTDVRPLWQLDTINKVESTTTNDTYDTNISNNDSSIAMPVITTTTTNTTNDIDPRPNDNITTLTPDTTESLETSTNLETSQQSKQMLDVENQRTDFTTVVNVSNEVKQAMPTTTDMPILSRSALSESTTESSMSTSTELITEVSVAISDSFEQANIFTSTSTPISNEVTTLDVQAMEIDITSPTAKSNSEEVSTEMPLTSSVVIDNSDVSTSIPDATTFNATPEIVNSRSGKNLDNSNSEESEVSNSLLDVILSPGVYETTKPMILEIKIEQEPVKSRLEVLSQVKTSDTDETSDKLSTENAMIVFNNSRTDSSSIENIEETTIASEMLLMNDAFIDTSVATEVPELLVNNPTQSINLIETEPSINPTFSIINTSSEENQEATTVQLSDSTELIRDENITDSLNTLAVEIQFHNTTSATVPTGTETLTSTKDSTNYEDRQATIEKFLNSISTQNLTSNNLLNNTSMAELMKIVGRFSINSTNAIQSSFNIDENNVDSSSDGLPQLLGGFLDNTNKSQSVINDSTVERNNETLVVTQTTSIFTISPEQSIINSENTDTTTEISSNSITQASDNNALETTTTTSPPITIVPSSINQINNLTQINNSVTNDYSLNLTRMIEIFNKLLGINSPSESPPDFPTDELLDSLTLNSTDNLAVVEDLTTITLIDDSINLIPTTMSIENETDPPDPTTVIPTLLTHFQDSTKATAQRTAGTNKRPNQTFTTLNPAINYPSSSVSSLNIIKTNKLPVKNLRKSTPAETTTTIPKRNQASLSSSTSSSVTKNSLEIKPSKQLPKIQQSTTTTTTTTTASSVGRFGTSRLTPAPKFSSSSSTTAPLRDYLIYGIFPNKTIVRKRPEDNLIDPRNVDSPYVIFGIYPDGKLVRKFPNGTVIPDPPSNPVEVVFSLSTTTTTNTPPGNQANNQGMISSNQNIDFTNNRNPNADVNTQKAFFAPNEVDNALSISGPSAPDLPIASVTSDNRQTTSTTSTIVPMNVSQNGQIVQDRTRDEVTNKYEDNNQRGSIFIGQDKIVNYWKNKQSGSVPKVLNVNINSATSAVQESSLSSPQSSIKLDIQPNSQTGSQVTAPPGFPWKDPLDQIFGIPTDSPVLTGSVASNTIDDANTQNAAVSARPTNNKVEIFSPVSSTINSLINNPTKASTTSTTTTTTSAPSSETLTTTTTTTTTTTQASTTPSSITTITVSPMTMNPNAFGTTFDDLAFLNALLEKPTSNEETPKTLTDAEQLLANRILSLALGRSIGNNGPTRSPKAIQPSNASPNSLSDSKEFRSTLSPSFAGSSSQPIVIDLQTSSTRRPSTSTTPFTWKPLRTFASFEDPTTPRPTTPSTTSIVTPKSSTSTPTTLSTTTTTQRTTESSTTATTRAPRTTTTPSTTTTTKAPVIITAKPITTRRPRTTTQAPPRGPLAFAANILQNIFGRGIFNPFAQTTTARPYIRRPASTVARPASTTKKLTTTTTITTPTTTTTRAPYIVIAQSSHTPRSIQVANSVVDITNGQLGSPSDIVSSSSEKAVEVTPRSASSKQSTITYSPEDDAKFLAALLNSARSAGGDADKSSSQSKSVLSADDEAFLRTILNGQATIKPLSTVGGSDQNDAALLAAFLKSQGIGPSTPESLKEQLQKAGHDMTLTTTTKRPTTITTTTVRRTTKTQRRRPSSSTYPPPLFGFGPFASSAGNGEGDESDDGQSVRSQVVNAAIGMTRAFGRFLGTAITGASQQFQSFVRNGTRWG